MAPLNLKAVSLLGFLFATEALAAADMAAAAFMWPQDRVWTADADNTAPCGNTAGPGERKPFPLTDGKVALVAQDDSYNVQLSISYLEDPKSSADFDLLIGAAAMRELDPGHTCVPIKDPPSSVGVGSKATLQVVYVADFDKPENQTFYACADIIYVRKEDFNEKIPCFNATDDGDGDTFNPHEPGASQIPTHNDATTNNRGLSGGAIAGIVVGVVAGLALIGAAALFINRKRQQKKRYLRQQEVIRNSKWNEDPTRKDSASQPSIRMQNL